MKTEEEEALEIFSISELLEMCCLEEADALAILRYHGYIELPDFLLKEPLQIEDGENEGSH